jgi:hypothetical protein
MSIVTLFTATATPGWLRDSVGVRSAKSDAVVGLSLDLNKSFKYRGRGEPAKAVECETQIVGKVNHHGRLMLNASRSVVAKRRETSH